MATAAIVDDEARDLECPVCQEVFRAPKMLPCGHTLCLSPCLEQLTKDTTSLKCPECRTDHRLPADGASGFPPNIFVTRLIETYRKRTAQTSHSESKLCPVCENDTFLIKCFHCNIELCEACRASHTVILHGVVRAQVNDLLDTVEDMNKTPAVNQMREQLQDLLKPAKASIVRMADELCTAINERRDQLLKSLETSGEKEITAKENKLKAMLTTVNEFCEKMKPKSEQDTGLSMTQGELIKLQTKCEDYTKEVNSCRKDVLSVKGPTLSLNQDDVLQGINTFGQIMDPVTEDKMEDDVTIVKPKESAPEKVPDTKAMAKVQQPFVADRTFKAKRCIGRPGDMPGEFCKPSSVAVCPVTGNIVVADAGNGRIQVFDEDGLHIQSMKVNNVRKAKVNNKGSIVALCSYLVNGVECRTYDVISGVPCYTGEDLAIDRDNNIHVCNSDNQRPVTVYKENGEKIRDYGQWPGVKYRKKLIGHGRDGSIYISSDISEQELHGYITNHYLYVFNTNYQLIKMFKNRYTPSDTNGDNVYTCTGISLTSNNRLLVTVNMAKMATKYSIEVHDLELNHIKTLPIPEGNAVGQLYKPTGVAVTLSGDLVVIGGNNMLQFF